MRHPLRLAAYGVSALLGLVLAGCGSDARSAAAVCHVFATDGVAFHDHYEHLARAGGNPDALLSDFGAIAEAPSRIADLMTKEAAVAPSDIAPAFQTVAATYRQVGDSEADVAGNPIKALATGLALSAQAHGAEVQVNHYLAAHCSPPR